MAYPAAQDQFHDSAGFHFAGGGVLFDVLFIPWQRPEAELSGQRFEFVALPCCLQQFSL